MKQLTDEVWMFGGFPPNGINVYLLGDVIVDAATRFASRRILRQVRGRTVSAHALTHAHPDHQGASKAICETLDVPLWCGEGDVHAMETPGGIRAAQPPHPLNRLIDAAWTGPPYPVARVLREGDEVGGFTVLETPGHSAGHLSFWRESDRTLICGDVLNGMSLITTMAGLHEPPRIFTPDPERNRQSIKRLAALEPALICFGHGPPMRSPGGLTSFAATLP
jgi:glyoxylase-like metal-dependent hydrolase (beta-lactamase superfamily II)